MSESKSSTNRINGIIQRNMNTLITIIISLICSLCVLCFYAYFNAKHQQRVGMVDLQSLMSNVTISTFKQIENNSDPDKQTQIAADNIKIGALKIEKAIEIVALRHNLILVQKQAIAYDKNIHDYTQEVKNEIANIK